MHTGGDSRGASCPSVSWGETALIGFAGIISKNTQLGGQPAIYLWLLAFPSHFPRVPVCLLWFGAGTLFQGSRVPPPQQLPTSCWPPRKQGSEGPRTLPQPPSWEKRVGASWARSPRPPPLPPPFPGYVNVPSLNLEHHPSSPQVPDGDLPGVSFHVSCIPSIPTSRRQNLICC